MIQKLAQDMEFARANHGVDLRISSKLAIPVLIIAALVLAFLTPVWPGAQKLVPVQGTILLLLTTSGLIALLGGWHSLASRWFAIVAMAANIGCAAVWLGEPSLLALSVLPVGLAAAMLGLRAAAVTVVAETLVLGALSSSGMAGMWPAAGYMAILASWVTFGLMVIAYRSTYQHVGWFRSYLEQAGSAIAEARERKVHLMQVLEDLALANRQLALLNERLDAMRAIAEEAQKAKSAFVAKVSHEFRTPLNMIIGLTALLVERPDVYGEELPESLLEDLQIVHRNCEHLTSMINDVLDLSQAEVGQTTLHRDWHDLGPEIDAAVTAVGPLLKKKGLRLEVAVESELPKVFCDRNRIRQVVLNLLSNAARFTEQGGVTLTVEQEGHDVVTKIADTGPGVAPEAVERIFEPFYQVTEDGWREPGGSGLGLTISKQFVERHGGQLWLESQPGAGSTFAFRLPIAPPSSPQARPEGWISRDWIFLERTSWPKVPELPYRQRIVLWDETGVLGPVFAHYADEIEFVPVAEIGQIGKELETCPAHAVILNAESQEVLAGYMEQARRQAPDTPVIGSSFPARPDRGANGSLLGYLTKPVKQADLEEILRGIGRPVKRVLLVDDNRDVQQLFTRMLTTYDGELEVTTLGDGNQVLEALRHTTPDLLLLDIVLPGMDGWQILERMEEDDTLADIPVVVVSANDSCGQPLRGDFLLATTGQGFSTDKLLGCSLQIAKSLLGPD